MGYTLLMGSSATTTEVDIISLVDKIFSKAIDTGTSDVHLDPETDGFNVRFRIDGLLYLAQTLEKSLEEGLISRIKVLSQLNITERRLPQDGHLEFSHQNFVYNIRISTFPTNRGESVVMRILDRKGSVFEIKDLGLDENEVQTLENMITNPFGIILVTGPIGSGKTSFLYSILNKLRTINKNIVTIEDPVEVNLPGVRQLQVRENIGLDFSKAIRSIARQDPNVIMVGEIRDNDTAYTAFQAALSGVLVFATFHTFDVPGLILRLLEMNIPRSVVAHSIRGVISIRLVRKICSVCHQPLPTNQETNGSIFEESIDKCAQCHGIGYFGRTCVSQIIPFDNDTRLKILEGTALSDLQAFFSQKGYKTLKEVGAEKVSSGITTAEEIARVIGVLE